MEKFNRTIKRIAALAGGAVMVGAALSGALAQLDKLPAPFVTSAGMMDSYVVVGTMGWNPDIAFNAAAASGLAQDIAVGIDVGAAFAQKATSAATAGASTVTGGTQVNAAGDDFNYLELAGTLKPIYSEEQLSVLADGTYKETKGATKNNIGYSQKIELDAAFGEAVYDRDKTQSTEAAGSYIKISKASDAYTYTLKFDSNVEWDNSDATKTLADWKGSKLTIEGKTYTVSETAGTTPTSITLMAGSLTATQGEYTTQTYTMDGKDYEVEVLIISDTAKTVKLKINGETTDALVAGETSDLSDGTVIGIDEIMPNEGSEAAGADQVTFFLGADKIKLVDTFGVVKLNDEEIDGYDITSDFNTGVGTLKDITITVKPTDDQWIVQGGSWVDPLFGNWQVMFTGLEKVTETIDASVSGQEGSLNLNSLDGKEIVVPVVNNDAGAATYWGDDLDWTTAAAIGKAQLSNDGTGNVGALAIMDNAVCTVHAASDVTDCEGLKFMVVSTGGEMRIFELTNVDITNDQVDVKDLSTGKTYEKLDMDDTSQDIGVISDFQIDNTAATTIRLTNINNYGSPEISGMDVEFKTSKNADVGLYNNAADDKEVYVQDHDALSTDYFSFDEDASDDLQLTDDNAAASLSIVKDSKTKVGLDIGGWGTLFTYDTDNKDSFKVEYPEEQVIFDVFVAPSGAAASGTSGAVNVNYINAATGVARTDADFAAAVPTKNVILIGGPSVNELVKDLVDANKTMAASAYAADSAIVQLVADAFGSNDALVIAGYAAKDTKLAGQVVAANLLQGQFSDKMTGSKVTINTAGATTVSGVSFA